MSADGGPAAQTNVDIQEILARIPHRYPFLLVDRAEDYRPSESIVGIKCVTFNEDFFQGHFPGNPVMPGVLIVEALAQTGAVLMSKSLDVDVEGKAIMFMSIDEARFRQPVRPGRQITADSRQKDNVTLVRQFLQIGQTRIIRPDDPGQPGQAGDIQDAFGDEEQRTGNGN